MLPFIKPLIIAEQNDEIVNPIEVVLTTIEEAAYVKSQTPVEYPVDKGAPLGRGAVPSSAMITVRGAMCHDPLWAPVIPFLKPLRKRSMTSYDLEYLFDHQLLVTVDEETIGMRENMLLIGLEIEASLDYEATTIYTLTFVEQRYASLLEDIDKKVVPSVDPYTFYDFEV